MCGIIGYVGAREATNVLMAGLGRLEYRGYDSAGIAVYGRGGLQTRRSVGKLANLQAQLREQPTAGAIGIGHTRWATHGGVSEDNAHPHHDASGAIVVIQNGIVENYLELKRDLVARGHVFRSQTDTEVIAHLVGLHYEETRSLEEAVRRAVAQLRGGNAVVALCAHEPDTLVAARVGHAGGIVIGLGEGEQFVASDMPAILDYTQRVLFLEHRELAVVRASGVELSTLEGTSVRRAPAAMRWDPVAAERGDHKHFMEKEIAEQPRALTDVLRGRLDLDAGRVLLDDLRLDDAALARVERLVAVGCGTAWHAALVGKFMVESLARVRVEVDYSSEFRYRQPILRDEGSRMKDEAAAAPLTPHTSRLNADTLLVAVTQSGETVDTLAAMEEAREQGVPTVALVNAIGSQAARLASVGPLYLHAGPEIGVASTKAFTTHAHRTGTCSRFISAQVRGTLKPEVEQDADCRTRSRWCRCHDRGHAQHVRRRGRGPVPTARRAPSPLHQLSVPRARQINYPIALEGALKLKEVSATSTPRAIRRAR